MRQLSLYALKSLVKEITLAWHIASPPTTDIDSLRHAFLNELEQHAASRLRYTTIVEGSPGVCFPDLETDFHVVDVTAPMIKIPIGKVEQKVYGLRYNLIVLGCRLFDNAQKATQIALPWSLVFIDKGKTSDYQTTFGLREILRRKGDRDDITAFIEERFPNLSELEREQWTTTILMSPPKLGYLSHSHGVSACIRFDRVLKLVTNNQSLHVDGIEELFTIYSDSNLA